MCQRINRGYGLCCNLFILSGHFNQLVSVRHWQRAEHRPPTLQITISLQLRLNRQTRPLLRRQKWLQRFINHRMVYHQTDTLSHTLEGTRATIQLRFEELISIWTAEEMDSYILPWQDIKSPGKVLTQSTVRFPWDTSLPCYHLGLETPWPQLQCSL